MNKTTEWINEINNDLVNPSLKLGDILLKVQVLAFKLKNESLKSWLHNELNGYKPSEIPEYRIIPTSVRGNLVQDRGLGRAAYVNNYPLSIEVLDDKLYEELSRVRITSSVSELEDMIGKGDSYQVEISYVHHRHISAKIAGGWTVSSAWKTINSSSFGGIISSIKSNLLRFLLELADEIGEQDNVNIMSQEKKIDNLFKKTIGNISGDTVNISFGNDNMQTVNTGDRAKVNVAKGGKVEQNINKKIIKELSDFIPDLKKSLENLDISEDDANEIKAEILRIETQLQREQPKYPVINQALSIVNSLLIEAAGSVMSPVIIEKISWFVHLFSTQP